MTRANLIVLYSNPRTVRDVLRLASPRFEVTVARTAAAALSAAQSAGPGAVLVAEHCSSEDQICDAAARDPGAVALLEATRRRCPDVRRVLLASEEMGLSLIPILHGGTADVIVPLPIEAKIFIAAIIAASGAGPIDAHPSLSVAPPTTVDGMHLGH